MDAIDNGLKLVLTYNIRPDGGQEYYEFVLGQYIPIMQSLGLEITEAWHTAYGNYPHRLLVFVSQDGDKVRRVVNDVAWDELNDRLLQFVTDFDYKVVPYRIGFQF